MKTILRNVLAILAGILVGSLVNMCIVMAGMILVPLPEGVDMTDTSQFAENLKKFAPVNFISPWLAHALGTISGSIVAAKISLNRKMTCAIVIGFIFLLGGISVIATYGGPVWFSLADLVGAYLPMAYLGGIIGGARKDSPPQSSI